MPTKIEIRQKYGKEFGDKILKAKCMEGNTVAILPNGEHDIPQIDVDRAIREIETGDVRIWD